MTSRILLLAVLVLLPLSAASVETLAGTVDSDTTGDGGPATQAKLAGPKSIEVGPNDAVYFMDTESHPIRRIDLATGTISTAAGDGTRHDGPGGDPLACGLAKPHGVFVDRRGNVYIGDSENHRVRVVRP